MLKDFLGENRCISVVAKSSGELIYQGKGYLFKTQVLFGWQRRIQEAAISIRLV